MTANTKLGLRQTPLALGRSDADVPEHTSRPPAVKPAKRGAARIQPDRFIRLNEVLHTTGFSRSTLYRLMGQGDFPTAVSISANAVAWLESEVLTWIARRIDRREQRNRCAGK
jgi:prophage regulatory protein